MKFAKFGEVYTFDDNELYLMSIGDISTNPRVKDHDGGSQFVLRHSVYETGDIDEWSIYSVLWSIVEDE